MSKKGLNLTIENVKELFSEDPELFLFRASLFDHDKELKAECVQAKRNLFNLETETPKEQGDLLEFLAQKLIEGSGFFINAIHNEKGKTHEIDHECEINPVIYEILPQDSLPNRRVLGESKNYKTKKIDVNIVYKVGSIARFQNFSLILLFSRVGLTGDTSSFACKITGKFKDNDNSCFVLFKDEDYELIEREPSFFNVILYKKLSRWLSHEDFNIDYDKLATLLIELQEKALPKTLR
ncbi:MAG: hypothetical protein K9K67_16240 [Bacteriovoracaceae bacterium]|nr:hypothetical protein [Bacteriovoracaceae bacterium]